MGRIILCGKVADTPYEVEELDLRLYSIEELCYYIYHNLSLISESFIDEKLIQFIKNELGLTEIAEKIEKFYASPADQDATLLMLIRDVGYLSEQEINDFQMRLGNRRKKIGPERANERAMTLQKEKRYQAALRIYKQLLSGERDGRLNGEFYCKVMERMADCYGSLASYDAAKTMLEDIYEISASERVLKKLYFVTLLSGVEFPPEYDKVVSKELLKKWQQEYWGIETLNQRNLDESEEMQMFLKNKDVVKEELKKYIAVKKELYRGMLE